MAKRHLYSGMYANQRRVPLPSTPTLRADAAYPDYRYLINIATHYLWTVYSLMSGNYTAIATIFVVVLLSFLLPDISHKIHATNELKTMKKVIDMMSSKDQRDLSVCTSGYLRSTQSEPLQVEKRIGLFRRIFFPYRNTSRKEVTLMSYLYTDSFDGHNTRINNSKKPEP